MFKMKKSVLVISILLLLAALSAASYFMLSTLGIIEAGKVELTIELKDNSKVYDGEKLTGASYEITNGSIANTHKLEVTYTSSITNVGEMPLLADARVVDEVGVDVTEDYDINVVSAMLKVSPRPITVKAKETSKIYDGTPIVAEDIEIVEGSLAKGEIVQPSVRFASNSSVAGSYEIDVTAEVFDYAGNNVSSNYMINTQTSNLVIDKAPLVIQTKSETYDFGPNMKIDPKYEIASGVIMDGDFIAKIKYKPVDEKVGVQVLSFDDKENWISIQNNGNDVTSSYLIVAQNVGVLTINPHTLKVKVSPKTDLIYNALDQTFDEFTYVLDEDAVFMADYSIVATGIEAKNVGTYENTLTFVVTDKITGEDVTDYFIFEQTPAELTIKPYELSNEEFVFDDEDIIYDGTNKYPHVKEAKLLGDDILDYDYKVYNTSGKELEDGSINVGNYIVEITLKGRDIKNYKVKNADDKGVITHEYEIKPKELEITTIGTYEVCFADLGKEVDIYELIKKDFKLPFGDSIYLKDEVIVDLDLLAVADSRENYLPIDFEIYNSADVDVTDNYSFVFKNEDDEVVEEIEVLLDLIKIEIKFDSEGYTKIYDGKPTELAAVDSELSNGYTRNLMFDVDITYSDYSLPNGCYIVYEINYDTYKIKNNYYTGLITDVIDSGVENIDFIPYVYFESAEYDITVSDEEDVTDYFELYWDFFGTENVEQREISVNIGDYTKEYDGEKIDKNVIRPAVFGVVDKDYEKVLKAIRNNLTILDYENVNAITHDITIDTYGLEMEEMFTDTGNYILYIEDVVDGEFEVTKRPVTVTIGDMTTIYSGQAANLNDVSLIVGNAVNNEERVILNSINKSEIRCDEKDVGTWEIFYDGYPSDIDLENYEVVDVVSGTLEITKRSVVITIGSMTEMYNGQAQNINNVSIKVGNAVSGQDNIILSSFDKSALYCEDTINAGTHVIEYDGYASDIDLENYEVVSIVSGTLEITKRPVVITIGSMTEVYNGQAQNINNVSIKVGNAVSGQDNIILSAFDKSALYCEDTINAGTHEIAYDGDPSDIDLENYEVVDVVSGTLEITKRSVVITIGSMTEVYNGQAQNINNVSVKVGNAVSGQDNIILSSFDKSSLYCEDTINAGTHNISYDGNPSDIDLENYEVVSIVSGTLEITKRPVVIAIGSISKVYDGNNADINSVSMTVSNAVSGQDNIILSAIDKSSLYCEDTINAGTHNISYDGNPSDIDLENYEVVDVVSGTLEIIKRQVTVTIGTIARFYDGTSHDISSVSMTIGNAVPGEENTILSMIDTSSLYCYETVNIGSWTIEYSGDPSNIDLENYEITDVISGVLVIY